jgi:hypothetical protein
MTDWEALTNQLRRVPLFADIKDEDSVVRQLHALEPDHWDRLIALVGEALENALASRHNQSMEQSDSEDALGDNSANFFYIMLEGELRATNYYGDQEIFLGES